MTQNPLAALQELYKDYALMKDREIADQAYDYRGFQEDKLPKDMVYMGPDMPPVRRPPMYRNQSQVVGGTDFAKDVDRVLTDIPEMRGRTPEIRNSPTDAVFDGLRWSGLDDNDYGETNLLGSTDIKGGRVTINPSLQGQQFFKDPELGQTRAYYADRSGRPPGTFEGTLSHEMGHVVGQSHGPAIDSLEGLAQDAYGQAKVAKRPQNPILTDLANAFKKR